MILESDTTPYTANTIKVKLIKPFKRQLHKMVKQTQKTNLLAITNESFEGVWPFCGVGT